MSNCFPGVGKNRCDGTRRAGLLVWITAFPVWEKTGAMERAVQVYLYE